MRTSSGRRRPERPPSLAAPLVVGTVVVLSVVVLVGQVSRSRAPVEPPAASPTPTVTPAAAASAPSPTASPSPSPTGTPEPEWRPPTGTPTWTPVPWPPVEPTPTRTPSPRRTLADCIDFRWTTLQTWVPPQAWVNVQIDVFNRCGRDVDPLDLWFEVRGYRQGDLVQVARGHPFDRVSTRFTTQLTIGLPGSQDWYDRITVEIVEPR